MLLVAEDLVKFYEVSMDIFILTFVKTGPISRLVEKRMNVFYLLWYPYETAQQSWNDCPSLFPLEEVQLVKLCCK